MWIGKWHAKKSVCSFRQLLRLIEKKEKENIPLTRTRWEVIWCKKKLKGIGRRVWREKKVPQPKLFAPLLSVFSLLVGVFVLCWLEVVSVINDQMLLSRYPRAKETDFFFWALRKRLDICMIWLVRLHRNRINHGS